MSVEQKNRKVESAPKVESGPLPNVFAGLFGLLLGLALVKFGNPVIMEKLVDPPANFLEMILNPWPAIWGYWLLAGVTVLGLMVAKRETNAPKFLVALPLAWLVWEFIAGTSTVDKALTRATLAHFTTCVVCFYLGLFSLSRVRAIGWFWGGLLAGFTWVLIVGFQQHFGGLEETRRYFYLYIYPTLKTVPPELLKKVSSNRIFATLFYPNALAGVILLVLPPTLAFIWSLRERLTSGARVFLMALYGVAALGCLYWSGSKGGWLLMLVTLLVGSFFMPMKQRVRLAIVGTFMVLGVAGFALKYQGFFKKGATSVVARGDYWRAAVETTKVHPVFGTGPGTFAKAYEKIKKPESEMSRLTHNDYLQQASDSGVLGFLLYAAFLSYSIYFIYSRTDIRGHWLKLGVWLGLLGWALQSTVEFGLYIPALSWIAFGFMGWLLGQVPNRIDRQHSTG
ncbi:O-antigen ligase family protein [Pedosphaera parvula]|uniref:O-antigen polymerase n=1 Tax=Pedosphaera parvula (strain Ellin514) TaxID=320771 RepID=B9XBX6_PEDPL|nr:O-antigen ligase family protein [Pedosphaera parvula]EEF62444.1 O-antigen polymerase [Pedosphaera parvula Ellin514]